MSNTPELIMKNTPTREELNELYNVRNMTAREIGGIFGWTVGQTEDRLSRLKLTGQKKQDKKRGAITTILEGAEYTSQKYLSMRF